MFDEFLLLTTALVGMAFLRASRRTHDGPRGYVWVLAAILGLTLLGVLEDSRFVGVVAMGLSVLVVVVPWALEGAARVFFGRGMLRLAVWAADARAVLMLGAGLGRQQPILRGLAVLERDGVDAAIGYFRGLAHGTEDGGELALINEQIVSMLLYGQRWDEGIRHYESRFPPRYAALRPALVLGLLRAYGEIGAIERAAALLQALEDGPVGNDPRSLGLVSQARLTFLVYAGAEATVQGALETSACRQLGLSQASGALFRGLAARQAGDAGRARGELERVKNLAGRRDDRVVESARRAMGEMGAPPVVLHPVRIAQDLLPYVEAVGARLKAFIRVAPAVQRSGALVATPAIFVVLGLGYFAMRWSDAGGLALLQVGASTPELIRGEGWWRIWTGSWVHGDPLGLLLDLYTIWFAAPLVERMAGSARVVIIALLGSAVGVYVSAVLGEPLGMVLGGGGPAATALLGAAGALLFKPGDGGVRQAARRRVLVPLAMVAVVQGVSATPGFLAVEASWHGLLAAVVVGALLAFVPARPAARWIEWATAVLLLAACAVALVRVSREDALTLVARGSWTVFEAGPARVSAPRTFEFIEERQEVQGLPLPLQVGVLDGLALRAGDLAQIMVLVPNHDADLSVPGLLLLDPTLAAELTLTPVPLPPAFSEASVKADAYAVRRNGSELGITLERRLGPGPEDPRVVLFAAPGALERQASIYARVLAEATLSRQ